MRKSFKQSREFSLLAEEYIAYLQCIINELYLILSRTILIIIKIINNNAIVKVIIIIIIIIKLC